MTTPRRYFLRIWSPEEGTRWQELQRRIDYPYAQDEDMLTLPEIPDSEFTPDRARNELIIYDDFTDNGYIIVDGVVTDEVA